MANLVFDFLHSYETGERRESEPANAYQYDEGHVLEAVLPEAVTSCEIHYWIRGQEKSEAYTPGSITQNDDGSCTVIGNIPNLYFETNGELRVYIVVTDGSASITTYEGFVHICQRSMPDDYVDDDPENEATRVLTEAQEAAATATAAAQTAQDVADSIPADYSQLSEDVDTLKDGLSAMSTATASDVGKALKAKTVSNGKVTEWEFGVAGGGLTDTQKELIIEIMRNALYSSDQSTNIDDLEEAFNKTVVSLSATVNLGTDIVYTDNTLESLRKYLTVTAAYDDQTSQIVTGYVLSGTLTVGTSVITITYKNVMTTVEIPVSQAVTRYTITNNLTDVTNSNTDTTIPEGNTYIGFLSANVAGYMPSNVSVTMGGISITSTAYDSTTHSITIENVSGDIVITAIADEDPTLPVYVLASPMTASGVIDYVLFNEDRDWTIEWTVSTPANSGRVRFENLASNNTHPFEAGSDYSTGTRWIKIWDSANQELNTSWLDGTVAGEQKIVITHDVDGSTIGYWYQSNMKSGRESYGQGSKTLNVGSSTARSNTGITVTISDSAVLEDFKIYKRVLTASEISEYVGWTVE